MIKCVLLTTQDIDNLNKNSEIIYLKALYQCESSVYFDDDSLLYENNTREFYNYKSSFYLSFISHKDSLSEEYLQARKALYKTYQQIKQEQAQELEYQISDINSHSIDIYKGNSSNLILESNDKNNIIIFLDSANSLSNLLHIHNNKIDIFTKDTSIIDIQELQTLLQKHIDTMNTKSNNTHINNNNANTKQNSSINLDILHSPSTQIFFYSHLLTGSTEFTHNPFFFGELNSQTKIGLDETKPIYHFSPKDESYDLGTLTIFLHSFTLTLLHYSLVHSSLNIKLTLTNKQSKERFKKDLDCHDFDLSKSRNDKK